MKSIKIILQTLLVSLLFLSCNSEENTVDKINPDLKGLDIALLGKTQLNLINNYHTKINSRNTDDEIEGFDKEIMGRFLNEQLSELSIHDFDLRYLDNDLTNLSNTFLADLMVTIDNFTNVDNFKTEIEILKTEVNNSNISDHEKKVVLGTIEITKNSTIYYAPTDLGGQNANGSFNKYSSREWSWRRAAKGAAAGSMVFFLGIGLTIVAPQLV